MVAFRTLPFGAILPCGRRGASPPRHPAVRTTERQTQPHIAVHADPFPYRAVSACSFHGEDWAASHLIRWGAGRATPRIVPSAYVRVPWRRCLPWAGPAWGGLRASAVFHHPRLWFRKVFANRFAYWNRPPRSCILRPTEQASLLGPKWPQKPLIGLWPQATCLPLLAGGAVVR